MTPTSWRSAPLPSVSCRQMATPPITILALSPALAFRAACRAGHRLPVPPTGRASGMSGRPVISQIRPFGQPPKSPGTLAPRALRETPITFTAWLPRPSSSVSSRALRTARRQANRLRRYVHLRTVTQPERSPANGFRRRLPAPPTRSVFAPHRRSPSVCQNDNLALKGRIRRSADSPSRQRLKAQP